MARVVTAAPVVTDAYRGVGRVDFLSAPAAVRDALVVVTGPRSA